MSEETILEAKDIGKFLNIVASYICYTADKEKTKAKDMHSQIESSIALGLLLTKQRPELGDACAQYWNYTKEMPPEEYVDVWLKIYKSFRDFQEEQEEKE